MKERVAIGVADFEGLAGADNVTAKRDVARSFGELESDSGFEALSVLFNEQNQRDGSFGDRGGHFDDSVESGLGFVIEN